MTKISSSYLSSDIDLDDVIFESEKNNNKKKHKKNKDKKKKNKGTHKIKNNKKKKKNKKDKDKPSTKYKYKYKKGILEDVVNVDVKSKINMDITDDTIKNVLSTGYNIVRCLVTKGKK